MAPPIISGISQGLAAPPVPAAAACMDSQAIPQVIMAVISVRASSMAVLFTVPDRVMGGWLRSTEVKVLAFKAGFPLRIYAPSAMDHWNHEVTGELKPFTPQS